MSDAAHSFNASRNEHRLAEFTTVNNPVARTARRIAIHRKSARAPAEPSRGLSRTQTHSMSFNKSIVFSLVTGCVVIPMMLFGNSSGADPRLTGAPGENTCTSCHSGTPLNGGAGSVRIIFPNSTTNYTPGVTQRVQVQVSDPTQRRWGFELSARLSSNAGQAGTIASVDGNTRVQTAGGVQYVTHSLNGTRNDDNNASATRRDSHFVRNWLWTDKPGDIFRRVH